MPFEISVFLLYNMNMLNKLKTITIFLILTCLLTAQSVFAESDIFSFSEYEGSAVTDNATMDRVYLFSLKDSPNSEMLLVESNGHYGLIDASYRSTDSFTGMNGETISAPVDLALSCPSSNGLLNAQYMIETLGVRHLDFIIGTHAHSDHIGGIPEIAEMEYMGVRLVDSDTIYFCKDYKSINYKEDATWEDPEFAYAAEESIKSAGGTVVHVNQNYYGDEISGIELDYSEITDAINSISGLADAEYFPGSLTDAYDDVLSFDMGDFRISIYNLFTTRTSENTEGENVNAIVALITKGEDSIVSLSDINVEQSVAQKISGHISDALSGRRVTFLIDAHHGVRNYSNSLEEADNYRPVYDLRNSSSQSANDCYFNFISYLGSNYSTEFYSAGDNEGAIVCDLTEGTGIYQILGTGMDAQLAEPEKASYYSRTGWHAWDYDIKAGKFRNAYWKYFDGEAFVSGWQNINNELYFFDDSCMMVSECWMRDDIDWHWLTKNGNALRSKWLMFEDNWYYLNADGYKSTGWTKISGYWYFMDKEGVMQTGWQKIDGKWYYFSSSGAMQTGWKKIGSKWYYFSSSGAMQTGWIRDNGNRYYLNASGAMLTGWQKIDGKWYYFNSSGVMQTGWKMISAKWYYMDKTGVMQTGLQKISGKYYFLDSFGVMQTGQVNISGKWYYFDASGVMQSNLPVSLL